MNTFYDLLQMIESKPCVGEGAFGSTERVDAIEEELKTAGSPYHRIKGKNTIGCLPREIWRN